MDSYFITSWFLLVSDTSYNYTLSVVIIHSPASHTTTMKLFKKKRKSDNGNLVVATTASKISSAPTSATRKSSIADRMKKRLQLNRSRSQKSAKSAVEKQVPADLARDYDDGLSTHDVQKDGRDEEEVTRNETRRQEAEQADASESKIASEQKNGDVCKSGNKIENIEEHKKESPTRDAKPCTSSNNEESSVLSTKSIGSGKSGRGSGSSGNRDNNKNESNVAVEELVASEILTATVASSSVRAPSPSQSVKSSKSINSVKSHFSIKSVKSSGSAKSGHISADGSETIESMTAFAGVASSKLNASAFGQKDQSNVFISGKEETSCNVKESDHSVSEAVIPDSHVLKKADSSGNTSNRADRSGVDEPSSKEEEGSVKSTKSNKSLGSIGSTGRQDLSNCHIESLKTEAKGDEGSVTAPSGAPLIVKTNDSNNSHRSNRSDQSDSKKLHHKEEEGSVKSTTSYKSNKSAKSTLSTQSVTSKKDHPSNPPKNDEGSVESARSNRSAMSNKSVMSPGTKQSGFSGEERAPTTDAESMSESTGLHVLVEENEFEVEVESVPVVVTDVVTVVEEDDGGCEMLMDKSKLSMDVNVVSEKKETEELAEGGKHAETEKNQSQEVTVVDKILKGGDKNDSLKEDTSAANTVNAPLRMQAPAHSKQAFSLTCEDQSSVKCDDTTATEECSVKTEKPFEYDTQKLVSDSFHGGLNTIARISSGVEEAADAVGKTILGTGVLEGNDDDDSVGSDYPGFERTVSKSSRNDDDGYGKSICGLSLGCHEALMGAGEAVHNYVGDADDETKTFLRQACASTECPANVSEEELKAQS